MPLLEVIDVTKTYDVQTYAVRGVSLTIEQGEILCLLGPSGCGKTTLLRMIAGLEKPDSGAIHFNSRNMGQVPPHKRGFGMMFQDFALFPHKNVRDNVAFGLRMQSMSAADISERIDQMLDLVDLEGMEERQIGQLSGGEQQRVALARSLAPGPQLLLLDEPLGALDRALRERLMLDVRAILKRVGMTAIYVTHDQTEAFAVGDRLAVMNAGEIVQIGTPQSLHQHPATPFVAQFLGFQNLLPGVVAKEGIIETSVGRFQPEGPLPPLDEPVTLLIKPAILSVDRSPGHTLSPVNTIDGAIEAVTFRGRFSQIRLISNGIRLLFEEPGDTTLRPGDVVKLLIAPDELLLYESMLH